MFKKINILALVLLALTCSYAPAQGRGGGGHGGGGGGHGGGHVGGYSGGAHGGGVHGGGFHGGHGGGHWGGRGGIYIGTGVGVGAGFGWGYWPYYPYSYIDGYPYAIYQDGTPLVEEQQPAAAVAPAAAPAPMTYYCRQSNAYFPQVQVCEEPWVMLPGTPVQ